MHRAMPLPYYIFSDKEYTDFRCLFCFDLPSLAHKEGYVMRPKSEWDEKRLIKEGYIAFGNALRHGYPCKQNRLRLASEPHLHCYATQRWVRSLSYLCQKERNLNRTVFDLGFFWRRKRGFLPTALFIDNLFLVW